MGLFNGNVAAFMPYSPAATSLLYCRRNHLPSTIFTSSYSWQPFQPLSFLQVLSVILSLMNQDSLTALIVFLIKVGMVIWFLLNQEIGCSLEQMQQRYRVHLEHNQQVITRYSTKLQWMASASRLFKTEKLDIFISTGSKRSRKWLIWEPFILRVL